MWINDKLGLVEWTLVQTRLKLVWGGGYWFTDFWQALTEILLLIQEANVAHQLFSDPNPFGYQSPPPTFVICIPTFFLSHYGSVLWLDPDLVNLSKELFFKFRLPSTG